MRVPVYIQPVSNEIVYLPQPLNGKEYDTLSSLNLPMNESGIVEVGACARVALGYRIVLPRGYVGMIKERRSCIEKSPFLVLAGVIDSNAMGEDTELEMKQAISNASLSNHPAIEHNPPSQQPVRMHPEVILYIYNCGSTPLEYTKGQSLVQLFVKPVCESQIQILAPAVCDRIGVPLRYEIEKV